MGKRLLDLSKDSMIAKNPVLRSVIDVGGRKGIRGARGGDGWSELSIARSLPDYIYVCASRTDDL